MTLFGFFFAMFFIAIGGLLINTDYQTTGVVLAGLGCAILITLKGNEK